MRFTSASILSLSAFFALVSSAPLTKRPVKKPSANAIPGEWILSFPTDDTLVTSFNSQLKDSLSKKYEKNILKFGSSAQVVEAFQRKNADTLLIKTEGGVMPDIESLVKEGAQVYENKMHHAYGVQRPAPWNLAVSCYLSCCHLICLFRELTAEDLTEETMFMNTMTRRDKM